jgi:hypothetical protein
MDVWRSQHWRQRGEELRAMAESQPQSELRDTLLKLAGELDGMAEQLEQNRSALWRFSDEVDRIAGQIEESAPND